jgi:hypothetical protein
VSTTNIKLIAGNFFDLQNEFHDNMIRVSTEKIFFGHFRGRLPFDLKIGNGNWKDHNFYCSKSFGKQKQYEIHIILNLVVNFSFLTGHRCPGNRLILSTGR